MSHSKDHAIKIFGKTISLLISGDSLRMKLVSGGGGGGDDEDDKSREQGKKNEFSYELKEQVQESSITEENIQSVKTENRERCSVDDEDKMIDSSTSEEHTDGTSCQKEKILKKPDKILPCPRCESMDTKFCYYNNYNVNQPRHFCKNCQRYWTAGGTMRNVPVGAGRRKNKHSAHFRHTSVSDPSLQAVREDFVESIHYPLKPNGTVLSFGSDTPLCESMDSALNLAERTLRNGNRNGLHPNMVEEKVLHMHSSTETCHEKLNSSFATNRNDKMSEEKNSQNSASTTCINGSNWAYAWPPPTTTYCSTNFQIPLYPNATYWTCAVPSASTYNVPWLSPVALSTSNSPGSKSPTLGKHSRDGDVLPNGNTQRESERKGSDRDTRIWVPKTLRIDDPDEAAKSSLWSMLGIKNGTSDAATGAGLFNAFQPMMDTINHVSGSSQLLRSNPAALARSLSFQETS